MKKQFFTLLEICIALTIIAIASSVIGINTFRAIRSHQFYCNFEKVKDHILFCKKMALMHEVDLYYSLENSKEGVIFTIATDEKLGLFKGEKKQKGMMKDLRFTFNKSEKLQIVFLFSTSGGVDPLGILTLTTKGIKEGKEIQISSFVQDKKVYISPLSH